MSSKKIKDVPNSVIYIMAAMFISDIIIASGPDVANILGQWWLSVVLGVYLLLWILAITAWLILATNKTECNQNMYQNQGNQGRGKFFLNQTP